MTRPDSPAGALARFGVFATVWWLMIAKFWIWGYVLGWTAALLAAANWPIALIVLIIAAIVT